MILGNGGGNISNRKKTVTFAMDIEGENLINYKNRLKKREKS